MASAWDRLLRRSTGGPVVLALGVLAVLALAGLAVAIGHGASRRARHRARPVSTGVTVSGRTTRYPSGVPASELTVAAQTSSTGPSRPGCTRRGSDLAAASRVARRFATRFVEYELGELGPRPAFAQATGQLAGWVWRQSHAPSPAQARARVTVTVAGAWVPRAGVAVVFTRARVLRPGLPAYPVTVSMTFRRCRWLASGL